MNPRLRQVRAHPYTFKGQNGLLLEDPLGLSQKAVFVPASLSLLLTLIDGNRDTGAIRTGFELRTGLAISPRLVDNLLAELDEAILLENDRFVGAYRAASESFRLSSSRLPTMLGKGYPSGSEELRCFIRQCVDQVEPGSTADMGQIVGLVSPHIDFVRGGQTYAGVWSTAASAIKEAELVVILGTDHNGHDSAITLTRQNYETPWGVLPTSRDLVEDYSRVIGEDRAFGRELYHSFEHSVEAAAIWLHYFLGAVKCEVLPVLCGTFQDFIATDISPLHCDSIRAMVDIIRRARETRRTLIVAAADLAHVGPAFGDRFPVDARGRADLAEADERLMKTVKQVDAEGLINELRSDGDRRRICGLPPLYLTSVVLAGCTGVVTGYEQCPASDDATSLVSICGVVFHSMERSAD